MPNHSGFYQGFSGYYMVFMNYIAALTLTRKIILLQFLSDYGMRASKAKVLKWKYFSITHSITYCDQKVKKNFCGAKVIEDLENPKGFQW